MFYIHMHSGANLPFALQNSISLQYMLLDNHSLIFWISIVLTKLFQSTVLSPPPLCISVNCCTYQGLFRTLRFVSPHTAWWKGTFFCMAIYPRLGWNPTSSFLRSTWNGSVYFLKGREYHSVYITFLGIWSIMASFLIILDVISGSFLRGSDNMCEYNMYIPAFPAPLFLGDWLSHVF